MNFGRGITGEHLRLGPKPYAVPGAAPASASRSLPGTGLTDPSCDKPRAVSGRIIQGLTDKPAIHHVSDPIDGQTGFRHVGGQNNHLDTRASLIKHSLLFRERQTAMKHTNPLCQSTFAKLTCQPLDVCLTGQEHQHHTSAMSHSHYFAKTMRSPVCSAWHCGITDINLKTFPLTTNNRRIKPGLQRFAVEGGRPHGLPAPGQGPNPLAGTAHGIRQTQPC